MNLKDEAFLLANFICYTKLFALKKEYNFHLKSFNKTEMHFRLEYCEYHARSNPKHVQGAGAVGLCGIRNGSIQLQWPPSWFGENITVKELDPVVAASAIWGGPTEAGLNSLLSIISYCIAFLF